jgi:asparagine synthase (glutamine-hydrolysing)
MCGFAGYFFTNKEREIDSKVILNMLELQRHRGPDDTGILGIDIETGVFEEIKIQDEAPFKISSQLVFGFNRLSILDLSPNGHQPMLYSEAGIALMMNGEVYNAFDYKKELIEKGFTFKGNTDTEVVLYLYVAFGIEGMLDRLNGMFSIVIYDGLKKELLLIRDRMGIKPLYLLNQEGRISFSSEMKSFKALPNYKFELDENQISEFLMFRNTINNTLFRNIKNVTPGTYLTIDSKGLIHEKVFYDLSQEGKENTQKVTSNLLESVLKAAVKRQMISDVKLGCQLSGGVDSSLVTAYAAEELPKGSLETVSIVFEDSRFSEKKYIDEVANKFELKSHQISLNAGEYFDLLESAVWHFEQPLNHPNTIGIKLLSREARKYVTVLLSGEGADESLAGYSRFMMNGNLLSVVNFRKLIKNKRHPIKMFKLLLNERDNYIIQTSFGSLDTLFALYPKFSLKDALFQRRKCWDEINDALPRKKRKYELLSYLPDLLMRQDKMSMAHSIENRVPFLDNEMITTTLGIFDADLINQHNKRIEGKAMLKGLCADIFGEQFTYRDKMGFGIPLKAFFESEIFKIKWQKEYLPNINKRKIFKAKPLESWMQNPHNMSSEQMDALWLIIGFEIWAKQYLD